MAKYGGELIGIALAYIFYRALKNVLAGSPRTTKVRGNAVGQIDDVMVKDPFCSVYFPKRDGVHAKVRGEDLYFCSEECRDRYMESQKTDDR